jgi:hypothetical protein
VWSDTFACCRELKSVPERQADQLQVQAHEGPPSCSSGACPLLC